MSDLHERISKFILLDHFDTVFDIDKSHGNFLVDKNTGKEYLDAFSFIASNPIGHNHPKMFDERFDEKLLRCARTNPSNSDILTEEFVEFVETFFDVAVPPYLTHSFFIAGGTLAVENALKVAFDWKYRRLKEKGVNVDPNELKIVHFKNSFHGRSGYSLSLTNTNDPRKYELFPKFPDWPRLEAPVLHQSNSPEQQLSLDCNFYNVALETIEKLKDTCAAIIIEPIQGEGGDNHFSGNFHENLRALADKFDMLLIYDEVQTGLGLTGKTWAHQHYLAVPDIICFGKKMQVCGILSGARVQEVKDNVFVEKSRINSTWGGNLVDMVRSQRYLEIIKEDNLVENAKIVGDYLLKKLTDLGVSNPRGKGLMCAFDHLRERDALIKRCRQNGLFLLGCGINSVRLRPSLTFSKEEVDLLIEILAKSL